jgi:hypothetical protein
MKLENSDRYQPSPLLRQRSIEDARIPAQGKRRIDAAGVALTQLNETPGESHVPKTATAIKKTRVHTTAKRD